jgi:hypothetical protein
MAFLGMFAEPIITSRGIIVGRDFDGAPHYVPSFPIFNPLFNQNSNQYSNQYSPKTEYKSLSDSFFEAQDSWKQQQKRMEQTENLKNQKSYDVSHDIHTIITNTSTTPVNILKSLAENHTDSVVKSTGRRASKYPKCLIPPSGPKIVLPKDVTLDYVNSVSTISICKQCDLCNGGVLSVGVIIVNKTKSKSKGVDYKLIMGKNVVENAYTEFTQKLRKNNKKMEQPTDAVKYMLHVQLGIKYTLTNNDFFDIKLRDSHVHRVYIVESVFDIVELNTFCKSAKPQINSNINSFSLQKIIENDDKFKQNKIIDISDNECKINKRVQKIISECYNNYY